MNLDRKLFLETKRYGKSGEWVGSDIREATDMEIVDAQFNYIETGKCDHKKDELVVYDVPGFIYDLRFCGICEEGLGLI